MLARILRATIPVRLRAKARKSAAIRWLLARLYSGEGRAALGGTSYTLVYPSARFPGFRDSLETAERAERRAATRLIAEYGCKALWDVGANIGMWTLHLASHGPGVHITAFEPDSDNLAWLKKNIDGNGLANQVTVRPLAISDKAGDLQFWADKYTGATGSLEPSHDFIGRNYGVERLVMTVKASTLDDELRHSPCPPDLIKIDVEGHELALLRGAERLLFHTWAASYSRGKSISR